MSQNEWIRIEDCHVNGWAQGIAIDPYPSMACSNISVRRCVVVDNYRVQPVELPGAGYVVNTGGFYAEQTNGLLVEDCVFDRNGWDGVDYTTRHSQNHNIYIQDDCTEVTVIGNISARGSGDNFQLRPIGTIHKNLSLKSPVHFSMGGDIDPTTPSPPRACDVLGNVALEGDDIDPLDPAKLLGWAYTIRNVEPPGNSIGTMRYNIAANKGPDGRAPLGIQLDGGTGQSSQRGIRDLHVHNNVIFEWGAPLEVITANPLPTGCPGMVNVVLHSNDVQEDWNPSQPTTSYAFKGRDSHAVTGWSSHGNRFFTRKTNRTFMRWSGGDFVVGSSGPPTNGWRYQIGQSSIVDGPPDSADDAVMDPNHPLPHTAYSAPWRTITTYHQSLPWSGGTGGLPEFMDQCRQQRKGYWRSQLTGLGAVQYFQQGFNMPNPLP